MKLTRRSFLTSAGALAASFSMPVLGKGDSTSIEEPYSDIEVTSSWMKGWMGDSFASAAGALHLGRFADPMYFLLEQIQWAPNKGEVAEPVDIPVGFVTDFASIPRIFWTALPRDGLYTFPAIIHDYLYWEQPVSRKDADYVLDCAMKEFEVPTLTRKSVTSAVRIGGGSAWRKNAALKASGEKRILRTFPDSPTITWSAWKQNPDAF